MTTTTLSISGAQLTVATEDLFRAWMEKHITHPSLATLAKPPLREGERYVGAIIRPDLSGYHVIRMPLEVAVKVKWQTAMDHAASKGGELPDRPEGALLFATREPGEFAEEWYWLREQHAGSVDFAWCQHFGHGGQGDGHKDGQYRVVLVRRVPIESLSH